MSFEVPAEDLVRSQATTAFGDPVVGGTVPDPRRIDDIGGAVLHGLRSSSLGLAIKGMPEQQLGEDAPWYHRIGAAAGGMLGDVPAMIAGGIAVNVATAGRAGPIATAAAAFAAPMAIREALTEAYTHNYATTWDGVREIGFAALKGATKGGIIGAVTAGAGRFVGPLVEKAGAGAVAAGTAAVGAEIATLTTTSAALEGHLPTWQDFMDNAILLGGLKGSIHVAKGLYGAYAETGKTPAEVVADARKDPTIKADLEAGKPPEAYAGLALEERIKAALDSDPRPEMIRSVLSGDTKADFSDAVKWEYVTDLESAKGVIRLATERYSTEVEAQRRGEVPLQQTALDALKLVDAGWTTQRAIGEAWNDGQIAASALILKSVADNAAKEIARANSVPPAMRSPMDTLRVNAAIEQVAMVNAEFSGGRAEAGRALNTYRALKNDLLGAQALADLYNRKAPLQDILNAVQQMKDPTQLARFAQDYVKATTGQKIIEAWRAGIFSGPQTWEANILGNVAKWTMDAVEAPIAAAIEAGTRAASDNPLKAAQVTARAMAPIYGLKLAAIDGLHLVRDWAAVTKNEGLVAGAKTVHADFSDFLREGESKMDVGLRANTGVVGAGVGFSFGMLKIQDLPFRTIGERTAARVLAVDRAIAEGWHPKSREFHEAVARYVENPTAGLSEKAAAEVAAKIEDVGAKAVFGEQLGSKMARVSAAISGTPWEFVIPARRTPVNLLDWAVQHAPGINLLSGRWREDFSAGGERQAKAIARVVVGGALAATAYSMTQNGMLTGGGLFDKDQAGTKAAAGKQPYSVVFNDKSYSIQRIEPVAKLFMLAGDLNEIAQSPKLTEEDKSKALSMLVLAFGNATISTTYMSGMANLFKAAVDPDRYLDTFTQSYATSLVPKVVGQSVVMVDPYKRQVDDSLDAIQSQIPFLREKLLPKRDVWGEPAQNNRWFDVLPIATNEVSKNLVRTEAARLHVAIANAPKSLEGKGPFKPGEQRISLSVEQRDVMREVSGKKAMEYLSPIVNAPDWSRLPDYVQANIYRKIISAARVEGALKALPPDSPARAKALQSMIDRMLREDQEAETRAAPAPERTVK